MTGHAAEIVYVACPYSDPDSAVQERRFQQVNEFCAGLCRDGLVVFSPISHTHPIAQYGLPKDWDFWQRFDRAYLAVCSRMIVYCLPGWRESKGVQEEIAVMKEMGKLVELFPDRTQKVDDMLQQLRDAGLSAWDAIDDPEEYIRELRE